MLAQSDDDSKRVEALWQDDEYRKETLAGIQRQKNVGGNTFVARSARVKRLWKKADYRATVVAAVSKSYVPVKFTPEVRKKLAEATSRAVAEGRLHPTGVRTHLTTLKGGNFLTKSSWETTYAKALDLDETVIEFKYEPIRIPYIWNGQTHFYLPDFWVKYLDHEELIEIKPKKLIQHPKNIAKISGAENQNIEIKIITEDDFDFTALS